MPSGSAASSFEASVRFLQFRQPVEGPGEHHRDLVGVQVQEFQLRERVEHARRDAGNRVQAHVERAQRCQRIEHARGEVGKSVLAEVEARHMPEPREVARLERRDSPVGEIEARRQRRERRRVHVGAARNARGERDQRLAQLARPVADAAHRRRHPPVHIRIEKPDAGIAEHRGLEVHVADRRPVREREPARIHRHPVVVEVRRCQQSRQSSRQHRLPASGRADHQDVVTTGRCDLKGAARSDLAPHVSQIEIVGAARAHAHRGGLLNSVHRLTSFGCVAAGNLFRIVIGPHQRGGATPSPGRKCPVGAA